MFIVLLNPMVQKANLTQLQSSLKEQSENKRRQSTSPTTTSKKKKPAETMDLTHEGADDEPNLGFEAMEPNAHRETANQKHDASNEMLHPPLTRSLHSNPWISFVIQQQKTHHQQLSQQHLQHRQQLQEQHTQQQRELRQLQLQQQQDLKDLHIRQQQELWNAILQFNTDD